MNVTIVAAAVLGCLVGPRLAEICADIVTCAPTMTVVSGGTMAYQVSGTANNDNGTCACAVSGEIWECVLAAGCTIDCSVEVLIPATGSAKMDGGACVGSPDGNPFKVTGEFDVTNGCDQQGDEGAGAFHFWQRWANATCAGAATATLGIRWYCGPDNCSEGLCP
jgi:hypothetical protein